MYVSELELRNQFQSFICTRKFFSNQTRYFFIIINKWYLVYLRDAGSKSSKFLQQVLVCESNKIDPTGSVQLVQCSYIYT